jgi:hypothetical protein
MKLQFEFNQEYPLEAIGSVVDIFERQRLSTGEYEFSLVTFTEATSLEDIQKSV